MNERYRPDAKGQTNARLVSLSYDIRLGPRIFGPLVKLRFPGIEHGYGKVIEVLDIPSR